MNQQLQEIEIYVFSTNATHYLPETRRVQNKRSINTTKTLNFRDIKRG